MKKHPQGGFTCYYELSEESRWFLPHSSHQSSQLSSLPFRVLDVCKKWLLGNVVDIKTKPSTLGSNTKIFNISDNSVILHKRGDAQLGGQRRYMSLKLPYAGTVTFELVATSS